MVLNEVVSLNLQHAVQDQLDPQRDVRILLEPYIHISGGLEFLITHFYPMVEAMQADDEEQMDLLYARLIELPVTSGMFTQEFRGKGKLSAIFLQMIIRAVQQLESSEPAPIPPEPES